MSGLLGRERLDLEGMDVALHEVAQRLINHSMPRHGVLAVECRRYDGELPVSAARGGAGVARMLRAFVAQIHRDRGERGKALADDFLGGAHYADASLRKAVFTGWEARCSRALPARISRRRMLARGRTRRSWRRRRTP